MSADEGLNAIDHRTRRRSHERAPLLLYDAHCSVCRRLVTMLIGADRQGTLRIAPLDSPVGDAIRRDHPTLEARDSAVWVRGDGVVSTHSDAILDAVEYLGGALTPLGKLLRGMVPRTLRDRAYTAFADNRHLFGQLGLADLDDRAKSRIMRD